MVIFGEALLGESILFNRTVDVKKWIIRITSFIYLAVLSTIIPFAQKDTVNAVTLVSCRIPYLRVAYKFG